MELKYNEVHIWHLDSSTLEDYSILGNFLEVGERQKAESIIDFESKKNYLLGKYMTRAILSFYCPRIAPQQWRFCTNEYGKPFVKNIDFQSIFFSLSHTSKLLSLAVARVPLIGIDVECVRSDLDVDTLAKEYFHYSEVESLSRNEKVMRVKKFFQLWTIKEAYIKAQGLGHYIPIDKIAFEICENPESKVQFTYEVESVKWSFYLNHPTAHHQMAVALPAPLTSAINFVEKTFALFPLGQQFSLEQSCRK